jgi:hypothetical protein
LRVERVGDGLDNVQAPDGFQHVGVAKRAVPGPADREAEALSWDVLSQVGKYGTEAVRR